MVKKKKKEKRMWYIHTMEYHSAIKKNEIMPFAATWMGLETVIPNEVRGRRNCVISLICRI